MSRLNKSRAIEIDPSEKKHRSSRFVKIKKSYLIIAALLFVIGAGGVLGYNQYDKVNKENKRLSDPQASAAAETDRIKNEVSKLIEVPANESPTIASVVDATKLNNQAFFAKAQNGDRVLMYAQAKKAILYRPSIKKIIEVAPINIGNNGQPQTPNPAAGAQETPAVVPAQ